MAYLAPAQVTIVGEENTKGYKFGGKYATHYFCKTCGIPLYMRIHPPSKELIGTPPEARQTVMENFNLIPINLKVLNDVEWEGLKVERSQQGPVGYTVD